MFRSSRKGDRTPFTVLLVYQNREIRKGFKALGDLKVDLVRRGTVLFLFH